jgi:hypothetical protein
MYIRQTAGRSAARNVAAPGLEVKFNGKALQQGVNLSLLNNKCKCVLFMAKPYNKVLTYLY